MDIQKRFLEVKSLKIGYDKPTIGVLSEKSLHKIIKNLYEGDISKQEIKIGKYYVDICRNDEIIEVQTKQFNKLRDKLTYLLSLNKYHINIIYPVFRSKMLYFIDDLGEITGPKKSPKKLKFPECFYELYKIKTFLNNPNICITLLVFDINEYRVKGKSRNGIVCYDRVPTNLVEEIKLDSKDKYLKLLPSGLNETFTASDVSKLTKCAIRYVNNMLNVLRYLGVIEVACKESRKYVYKVVE